MELKYGNKTQCKLGYLKTPRFKLGIFFLPPWNVVDEDELAVFPGKFVGEPSRVCFKVSPIRIKRLHVRQSVLEMEKVLKQGKYTYTLYIV